MKNLLYSIFLILLAACYEDKGNYSYRDINRLSLGGVDSTYIVDQFDTLFIDPRLQGTFYSDDSKFDFEWEIDRKIVGHEKSLRYVVKMEPTAEPKFCRLIVTDKELGTRAFFPFNLSVSSATAGDAIVILSRYQGRAELSFLRLKEGSKFAVNYYQEVSGKPLGTGPRKMYQQYKTVDVSGKTSYLDANYGFQVLLNEGLKTIEHQLMVEGEVPTFIDEAFFSRINPNYLPLEFTDYHVEGVEHAIVDYQSSWGYTDITSALYMISGGRYYMVYHTFIGGLSLTTDLPSPYGGYLAPETFAAYKMPKSGYFNGGPSRGYNISNFRILYDNTFGRFAYRDFVSGRLKEIPTLPAYEGYELKYATHTRDKNICLAVLASGSRHKALLLRIPGTAAELVGNEENGIVPMPFEVRGDVDVSGVIGEKSSFYTLAYEPYTFFTTGAALYKFNHLNLQAGIGPDAASKVADLSDYGYGEEAVIACMRFSRSEKNIVMGISRYESDEQGMSEELRGDLLVIDATTFEPVYHYKGIAGMPVDVMVKYQSYYRDGKDNDDHMVDPL